MRGHDLDGSVWRIGRDVLVGGRPPRRVRLSRSGTAALEHLLSGRSCPGADALAERLCNNGMLLPPPGPSRRDQVTVVVPALATATEVRALLVHVPADVRVVVVDDGSPHQLASELTDVCVLRHRRQRGPAAARNTGLAHVRTPLVAFLDVDVTPPPGWLDDLSGHLHNGVVAAAPRVTSAPTRMLRHLLDSELPALDRGPLAALVQQHGPVTYLPTAVLIADAALVRELGGFREHLLVGEDVDLVWRLSACGDVRYDPHVVVMHRPRAMAAALRRRYEYAQSVGPLERLHPGRVTHLELRGTTALVVVVACVHPLLAAAVAVGIIARGTLRAPSLPTRDAVHLLARRELTGLRWAGRYVLRPSWPIVLLGAFGSSAVRRCVPTLIGGYLASLLPELSRAPRPRRALALLLDDLAVGAGAWTGAVRARRLRPLLPRPAAR